MGRVELIEAVRKTHDVITSCDTCIQIKNTENYLENFKRLYKNEEFYQKLHNKLQEKKQELDCDFRY
jgi:hypothetical protein